MEHNSPRVMTRVSAPTKPLPKPQLNGDAIELEMPIELSAAAPPSLSRAREGELCSLDAPALPRPRPRPVSVQGKITRALDDIAILLSEHLCGAGEETLALVQGIELELRAARGLIW